MIAIGETGNRVGIKHPNFHPGRTNGVSHRRNALKKKQQHLKNVATRSRFYSEFQGEKGWMENSPACREWHETLKALSAGTV